MRDELLRKIQQVLGRRITNEMQVVYLLVELRKLMDREAYKDAVLRMFCNWVVHTSLEKRTDGSTLILSEIDDYMAELHERQKLLPHPKHMSLGTFREALIRCFAAFGLTPQFFSNLAEWKKFFNLYASIVSECPIVFTASRRNLKYIKKAELRGLARGVILKEWPVLQWRLTFHDGSIHNWGFHMG